MKRRRRRSPRAVGRRRKDFAGRRGLRPTDPVLLHCRPGHARRFVEGCRARGNRQRPFPRRNSSVGTSPMRFTLNHLRLFYARALTQRLMYDEAFVAFSRLDPAQRRPCDLSVLRGRLPAAIAQEGRRIGNARQVAAQHRRRGRTLPAHVATLMQTELQSIDDQSLDLISRKMQDSERRLDLGRGGQRVQKVQEEIVESLSDLIKKMEQQSNAQAQAGQGENNSNRSSGPAGDSSIKGATAPGDVDKKNLKKQGGWGDLPAKPLQRGQGFAVEGIPHQLPRCGRTILQETG